MRQTKALKWLSVMQMAKFFSQYGVRGILVLLRRWKSHISPKESFRLHGVGRLPGLLGALVLFFAAEDQICSSLILFAERECDRAFLGWMIPGSVIVSVNPLVILLLGTTIARLRYRFLTPFVMVALSFGALALLCMLNVGLTIFSLMGIAVIVSIAELMVGPLVMSKVSEIAAEGSPGVVMGLVPIAFSLAFLLSGALSKLVAEATLETYGTGFGSIAILILIGGVALHFCNRWLFSRREGMDESWKH